MFRKDLQDYSSSSQNMDSITIDMVLEIQKDLDPYDIVSLVFLLYEIPDTALQRLIVYQKVSKDVEYDSMNLLHQWATHAKVRPTWKYEFLESLSICRLYNVIRKLGFDLTTVKQHYQPDNITFSAHVSPIKKVLYNLCDNTTSEVMFKLKKTLLSYGIDTTDHESCELIILELICRKFIVFQDFIRNATPAKVDVQRFCQILDHFPAFASYVAHLKELENKLNGQHNSSSFNVSTSTPVTTAEVDNEYNKDNKGGESSFEEVYELLNQMNLEDIPSNWKADNVLLNNDSYFIRNPKRVGVCCIINQEIFNPSKENIEKNIHVHLPMRSGSTQDQIALESTMLSLNFEVIVGKNLNHIEVFNFIKDIIKYRVSEVHSVFMLCILSHGIRGHVYAADSIKIKIEDIQMLLDSDIAKNLYGKPKVLILQACQVDEDSYKDRGLVADGPPPKYFMRKSDFLIYWATSPEFKAFRHEEKGSIFIQFLCSALKEKAQKEHVYDIFTKVNNIVTKTCCKVKKLQVPIFESTLRKKLYLYIPSH
ncbi:caspase-8 [Zerene cesonia]|uniref:caspase-8 n=1 Tax=Zerene cesonia TaxID=33412 RepID=UPI0018E57121|nr:caspase-8 [Zerene cesonia]